MSEDLREKVARAICYWSEPSTCHDQYCSTRCIAVQPDAWCWRATDAILNLIGGDGWKLVPVEPTREMLKAAGEAFRARPEPP